MCRIEPMSVIIAHNRIDDPQLVGISLVNKHPWCRTDRQMD